MKKTIHLIAVLAAALLGSSIARAQGVSGPGVTPGPYTFVIDASKYGAAPNDSVDDAVAIQAALTAANTAGGGKVTVTAPGVYNLSTTDATLFSALTIGDNTELNLAPGVILRRTAGQRCYILRNMAGTLGNKGIRVTGGGTIDGNAKWITLDGTYDDTIKRYLFQVLPLVNPPTTNALPASEFVYASGDTIQVTSSTLTTTLTGGSYTDTVGNGGTFVFTNIDSTGWADYTFLSGDTLTVTAISAGSVPKTFTLTNGVYSSAASGTLTFTVSEPSSPYTANGTGVAAYVTRVNAVPITASSFSTSSVSTGNYTDNTENGNTDGGTFVMTGVDAVGWNGYSYLSGDKFTVTAITGAGTSASKTFSITSATYGSGSSGTLTIHVSEPASAPYTSAGTSVTGYITKAAAATPGASAFTTPYLSVDVGTTGHWVNQTSVDARLIRTDPSTGTATVGWLGQGILFTNCTDSWVTDLTFKHESKYTVWFAGGQRFGAERLYMFTASDGVHIEGTGQAVTGMYTPLPYTSEFVVRDISGWCGDNKVAIGSDEGTYYTPNGGPFSKGDVYDGLIENISCENDWEPFRAWGSATTREVSRITARNFYGTVRRGQGLKLATDSVGSLSGGTHKKIVFENISLTCGQTGSCPIYIDSAGTEDVTIRGLNSTQTSNTAALIYVLSSSIKSLMVDGGSVGSTSAGYQGKIVEFGAGNTNVPTVVVKNMNAVLNGARVILVNHASTKVDATVDSSRIIYGGGAGNGGDCQIFDVISTNAGGNIFRLNKTYCYGNVSSGTNGTGLKNQITQASAATNYFYVTDNYFDFWETMLVTADDADNKTVVYGKGNVFGTIGAVVSGALSSGAVSTPGSSIGLLRFLAPDMQINGTWTRGTQVAGDSFINTSTATSGGSPSTTNWALVAAGPTVYDGTLWKTPGRDTRLISVASISLKATGTTTLYTPTSGVNAVIRSVVLRVTGYDTVSGSTPVVSMGTNSATYDDMYAATTLTGFNAVDKVWKFDLGTGIIVPVTNSAPFIFQVDTAATATTYTATAYVYGDLY